MRKLLMLSLLASGVVLPGQASDLGLGVTLGAPGTTVYVPWKISPELRLEGSLSYSHHYSESPSIVSSGTGSGLTFIPSSSTNLAAGIGGFWVRPVTENTQLYMGSRIEYLWSKRRVWLNASFGGDSQSRGYAISPALGFEYFPIKSLSLGGEVGVSYSKTRITDLGDSNYLDREEHEGSFSKLILRYYF